MTDVALSSPVTDAALALLRTTGKQIGDARKPDSPEKPPRSFYPYAVVYVSTVRMQGTLPSPKEDGQHRVQVTSVGLDRAGAEWMRDHVRDLLLDVTAWDIDEHAVVWTDLVTSQPITRDDDVTPALFYAVDIVDVLVTPAASGS